MVESGTNVTDIAKQFRDYNELIKENIGMSHKNKELGKMANELDENVSRQTLKLSELEKLKTMSFTLGEFKQLHNVLVEIAEENEISTESAISTFFEDLESDYNEFLGFKAKLLKLKEIYDDLNERYNTVSYRLLALPGIGSAIASLFQKGLNAVEIARIINHLNNDPELLGTLTSKSDANEESSQSLNPDKSV